MPDSVNEEDQERPVQEVILIDRSMGKLVHLVEKIDMLIEKNDRLLNKATLKIKSESLIILSDNLLKDIDEQKKHSTRVEEKIKAHHTALKTKSISNNETTTDLEDTQVAMNMASVQLNTLNSLLNSQMQKKSLAVQLKQDLVDTKEQITARLYKNVQSYLTLFSYQVCERD